MRESISSSISFPRDNAVSYLTNAVDKQIYDNRNNIDIINHLYSVHIRVEIWFRFILDVMQVHTFSLLIKLLVT